MPFRSQAQRAFLAIHHPDVAHKFAMDSGSSAGKKLPYKVGQKRGGIGGGGGPLKHMFPRGQ